jgi:hypothetical protein
MAEAKALKKSEILPPQTEIIFPDYYLDVFSLTVSDRDHRSVLGL